MIINLRKVITFFGGVVFSVHTLTYFQINILLLTPMASLLYLIIVPGLLIMLLLRIREIPFWEYLVYLVGLSVSFLMLTGVLANWLFPLFHITSRPLTQPTLTIVTDILLAILAFFAYIRNHSLPVMSFGFSISKSKIGMYLLPIIFPILSYLGANYLGNTGSNVFTMVSLIGVSLILLIVRSWDKNSTTPLAPWYLWMISLSISLMGWLRSNYVSGADINLEYSIFQIVKESGIWSYSYLSHAYNACLSITILPVYLSNFLNVSDVYIFKFILPIIYALTPVVVYVFLRRFSSTTFALLAAYFFIIQPTFLTWWWIPVRQEFSLLFFTLSILTLFNTTISKFSKNFLFFVFSFSMIVSHYSTTYIALAIYFLTYFLYLLFEKYLYLIHFFVSRFSLQPQISKVVFYRQPVLTLPKLLILVLFAFFWYSQITTITGNISSTFSKVISNLSKITSEDNKSEGASLQSQINVKHTAVDKSALLLKAQKDFRTEYIENGQIELYAPDKFATYIPKPLSMEIIPKKVSPKVSSTIYLLVEITKKFFKIFIAVGTFYLLFYGYKQYALNLELSFMFTASFLIMILMLILPYVSIDYDLMRTYQQLLVLLSAPMIYGAYILLSIVRMKRTYVVLMCTTLTLCFFSNSGVLSQILGNSVPLAHLNNYGDNYDQFYFHASEWHAAEWLSSNGDGKSVIYSDNRTAYRLWHLDPIQLAAVRKQIFPSTIGKNSYVYSGYVNTLKATNYLSYRGDIINFNYPTDFLQRNKNTVYSTKTSAVYK